ncbi:MAG: family 43 glycosylhydrolase [Candidatus Cellulosilyticum pullistercoris]|uniref:Family 43 glycosylhydrolase n=1 Tax=Candidatus Cellulosilyticum pullistercoris TaxID=2838521 RepID=A0A9E2NKD7_9FIRM|nr:family 43 glycosylhydrolase [Candidatus Cellulosilyticum pullistercoris]
MKDTDIFLAVQEENLEWFKEILSHYPRAILLKSDEGIGVPFLAAATGNYELVKYIIEYSIASMNERDSMHQSILHYAAKSGNVRMLKYLVEKVGMSPVEGDKVCKTPYDIVHELGYQEAESYFEQVVGVPLKDMYRNPIRTGMHPDPSIVRVGEDYYMVNSSFIFFPCIPISHSKDLIHWKVIGHAITNPEWAELEHLEGGRGYWAPDISYYEGRFYITATYRMNDDGTVYRKQMVTSSDKPEGPYCKPTFIDEDGIDPSIFTDEDGRRYMLLNRGARIFEISKDGTKKLSEPELLWYGDNKRAPEGPHLLKKDGYYYLFMAEGGTGMGHRITVARSKTLKGNYEPCPYNPIMRQHDEEATIQRAGHGKPVMTQNGEWYMVYLCGRPLEGRTLLGRETAMDPITWTADGWPIVNHLKGPSVLQKKPNLKEYLWEETIKNGFGKDRLSSEWVFPRSPKKEGYVLKDGKLLLKGDKADLNEVACRSVVLQKQIDFCFSTSVQIKLEHLSEGQNLGLTGYYDENTYLKFGIYDRKDQEEGYTLAVSEWIYPNEKRHFETVLPSIESIFLRMDTHEFKRSFYYSEDGENWVELGSLPCVDYLCDEGHNIGKRFTGAMVGVYAYGGEKALTGVFSHFSYHKLEEER